MSVASLAELLARFGSAAREAAVTTFVTRPGMIPLTVMLMLALAPFAIVPNPQTTVPLMLVHDPILLVAETKLTPAGRASVTTTSEPTFGPRFVSVMEYVKLLLRFTLVEPPMPTARSAKLFSPQQVELE